MDFSWSELMVVGIVALIVIGPKDLPGMFRELGRFTAKLRAMGREFSRAMDDAAKESGIKDVAADLKKATSPKAMGLDAVKSAADKFERWDPMKNSTKPTVAAGAAAAPTAVVQGPATTALAEKVAARKAAAIEAAGKLRATSADAPLVAEPVAKAARKTPAKAAPKATRKAVAATAKPAAATVAKTAPKAPGRVRKAAKPGDGETA